KLEKNRSRAWPDWRTVPVDQPIEHVRSDAPTSGDTAAVRPEFTAALDAVMERHKGALAVLADDDGPPPGECDHRLHKQGDIFVWPFDTPSGRVTITWCARCGAIKVGGLGPSAWARPAADPAAFADEVLAASRSNDEVRTLRNALLWFRY